MTRERFWKFSFFIRQCTMGVVFVAIGFEVAGCSCSAKSVSAPKYNPGSGIGDGSGDGSGDDGGSGTVTAPVFTWNDPLSLADNISPDGSFAHHAMVAMGGGSATVYWEQAAVSGYNEIFTSLFSSSTWMHPATLANYISPGVGNSGTWPEHQNVAMDSSGNAIFVYLVVSGPQRRIFKNELRGGILSIPADFNDSVSPAGDAMDPVVAMDNSGNAVIVWRQLDGSGNYQIFKSEYRAGTWTHPASINDNISPDGSTCWNPRVAMDNNGSTIIVWDQDDGTGSDQVFKSEYRSGVWTHPSGLADNISISVTDVERPLLAMSDNGTAIIVWTQEDTSDSYKYTFVSRYSAGVWTHPSSLSDHLPYGGGTPAADAAFVMNTTGDAVFVWATKWPWFESRHLYKAEFRSGAWTVPVDENDFISPDLQDASRPKVAMDRFGQSIVVWDQSDGVNLQIFKSEYRAGAWSHPATLADNISPDGQDAQRPSVAMDASGTAIIVWEQSDGSDSQIFKSEYR